MILQLVYTGKAPFFNLTTMMIGRLFLSLFGKVLVLNTLITPTSSESSSMCRSQYQQIISGIYNRACPNLYIQLNTTSTCCYNMAQLQIIQSSFDPKPLKQLLKQIDLVSFDQPPQNIIQEIEECSPKQFLWAIANNPAYFVQHQLKSAAILRARGKVLIVWKPKYIEYPSLVKFPELREKKPNNLQIEFAQDTTTTAQTNQAFQLFIQNFYGTFFYSDQDFQTNLVTYSKHFISKISKHCYWHSIIDDTNTLFVSNMKKMDNICRVRITGMKQGYDKTLLLFSYKGQKDSFFGSAKNKWMQLVSFLAMLVIFYAIVACPADSTEGICQYRQQLTLGGAGIMLALMGLRFGQKNKKKKKSKLGGHQSTDKQD